MQNIVAVYVSRCHIHSEPQYVNTLVLSNMEYIWTIFYTPKHVSEQGILGILEVV